MLAALKFLISRARTRLLLTAALMLMSTGALAAKPENATRCYKAKDPVHCLIKLAQTRTKSLTQAADRADALGELLYAMAITGDRNDVVLREARKLSAAKSVKPVKQMDLLYAIDLYASAASPSSDDTYARALGRFARLDRELKGSERIELYLNACSIVTWDPVLRERWIGFAQSVCTPDNLLSLPGKGGASEALIIAMMPLAMTLAEDAEGFAGTAEAALTWLENAEQSARESTAPEQEFVAFMGVLIHTFTARCLDAFELPEDSDREVEAARQILQQLESRTGISARSSSLRREVIESMFETGREAEAKKMLGQLLSRIDANASGKKFPLAEQVATLLLAARLEHYERTERPGVCAPEGAVEI